MNPNDPPMTLPDDRRPSIEKTAMALFIQRQCEYLTDNPIDLDDPDGDPDLRDLLDACERFAAIYDQ